VKKIVCRLSQIILRWKSE